MVGMGYLARRLEGAIYARDDSGIWATPPLSLLRNRDLHIRQILEMRSAIQNGEQATRVVPIGEARKQMPHRPYCLG